MLRNVKSYVKKCELYYQDFQAWCILQFQSPVTQGDSFLKIFISFDNFLKQFHPSSVPPDKNLVT